MPDKVSIRISLAPAGHGPDKVIPFHKERNPCEDELGIADVEATRDGGEEKLIEFEVILVLGAGSEYL